MKTISLWQILAYRMMSTASVFLFFPVIFVLNFVNLFASCWPLLNKQWIWDWCSSDTWSGEVKGHMLIWTDSPKITGVLERPINCVCLHPRSSHPGKARIRKTTCTLLQKHIWGWIVTFLIFVTFLIQRNKNNF